MKCVHESRRIVRPISRWALKHHPTTHSPQHGTALRGNCPLAAHCCSKRPVCIRPSRTATWPSSRRSNCKHTSWKYGSRHSDSRPLSFTSTTRKPAGTRWSRWRCSSTATTPIRLLRPLTWTGRIARASMWRRTRAVLPMRRRDIEVLAGFGRSCVRSCFDASANDLWSIRTWGARMNGISSHRANDSSA
jgi:hypothetical protein